MHAISYQLKRGHLSAVAIGRRIFRGTKPPDDPDFDGVRDMTPARFDILYLVFGRKMRNAPAPRSIEMTELRAALGLARATISKAVKRLVELGLVTCGFRPSGSQRNKVVFLTEEGEARMKRALHLVFTGRQLARHYRRFISNEIGWRKKNLSSRILIELERTWHELQALARHHFDKSRVLYDLRTEPDPMPLPKPAPIEPSTNFDPAYYGDETLDDL